MPLELRRLGGILNAAHLPLSDPQTVDWNAVDTARVAYNAIEGFFDDLPASPPAPERARQRAYVRYFQQGNAAGARVAWQEQSGGERDLLDVRLLAGIEADSGSDSALPWIERIRAHEPAEADALAARLRLRQGRIPETLAALQASFTGFRTDPWPTQGAMQSALNLVTPLTGQSAMTVTPLLDALSEPFVVHALNVPRLAIAAELSRGADFLQRCAGIFGQFEPDPMWNQRFLTLRRDCYRATGSARVRTAEGDLDEFMRREPLPLAPR